MGPRLDLGLVKIVPVATGRQQANFAETSVKMLKQTIRTTLNALPTRFWPTALQDVKRMLNFRYSTSRGWSPYVALERVRPRWRGEVRTIEYFKWNIVRQCWRQS